MPKMGESIMEATILKWIKQVGDTVEMDETILEIATDKVDSEVPSPAEGKIIEILFQENDVVEIGKTIAVIATEGEQSSDLPAETKPSETVKVLVPERAPQISTRTEPEAIPAQVPTPEVSSASSSDSVIQRQHAGRFYSPLVRNIAHQENIGQSELDSIPGTGMNGRLTKRDILAYVSQRNGSPELAETSTIQQITEAESTPEPTRIEVEPKVEKPVQPQPAKSIPGGANVEIIEMDRMRKLIADHMVRSKQTSPHVTSFVEADVTNLVEWRNSVKADFQKKHGEKITFTPIFIDAVVKAIKDYPMVNITVEGDNIIRKLDINIGMAAALPSGNLIVPVIKNADQRNLLGLTKAVNDLAGRARSNKLKPEEIQGGTFTLTNVGTFGNVMGTPIINQPQVAIMATGAIRKKPAVVETEYGDLIAIRHMMYISLSYDHRVVDGFLGGSFLRRVADYLEDFDRTLQI
jgi:2-oxoglutarate dehydrogenase E2 component (dihydrolipoamide succinyltransferase)